MVFSEESSTVGAFLLRARREGLRDFGACMSPQTAFQILQGIETLPLRMPRHVDNTRRVVEFLVPPADGGAVAYPELRVPSGPRAGQAACCRTAAAPCSASTSKAGALRASAFIETLQVFSHLANVGDAKSLVIHPATTTHYRMDDAALRQAGITAGTVRLSIGLEDADDLVDDLKRALRAAQKAAA